MSEQEVCEHCHRPFPKGYERCPSGRCVRASAAARAAAPVEAGRVEATCPRCGSSDAYHGVIVEVGQPQRWACDECGHIEETIDLCGYSRDGLVCIHVRGHGVPEGENIGRHHMVDPYADADLDPAVPGLLAEARRARPRSECTTPCCDACGGRGADASGPCGDCYGTGHVHPLGGTS